MAQQKIIAHFDLDSFFVSVELLNNPMLKGQPVIVGGKERGVVSACSYEARKFGIQSGMPSSKAKNLCPQAIFISGSYADYSKYSRWVTQIIEDRVPLFEKASVDEFYIDLTGMEKYFNPLQFVIDLRQQIIDETGLPISFGLSINKMVAKIATNQAKPNGYLHVPFGKEQAFLAPLPVEEIPGVGKQTLPILHGLGIKKIGDISKADPVLLEEYLGKWGSELWKKSFGTHTSNITPFHESKSISSENTFSENKTDVTDMQQELVRLTEKICYQLRREEKVCGCVAVKIRYADFETTSRQTTIDYSCADDEIIPVVKNLFKKLHRRGEPVRLLGVRLSELTNDAMQTNLFSDIEKKAELYKAIDTVKNRFGRKSVKRASSK